VQRARRRQALRARLAPPRRQLVHRRLVHRRLVHHRLVHHRLVHRRLVLLQAARRVRPALLQRVLVPAALPRAAAVAPLDRPARVAAAGEAPADPRELPAVAARRQLLLRSKRS